MVQPYVAKDPGGFNRLLNAKFKREKLNERKKQNLLDRRQQMLEMQATQNKLCKEQRATEQEQQARESLAKYIKEQGAGEQLANVARINPELGKKLFEMNRESREETKKELRTGSQVYTSIKEKLNQRGESVEDHWDIVRGTLQKYGVEEVPEQYNSTWDKEMEALGYGLAAQEKQPVDVRDKAFARLSPEEQKKVIMGGGRTTVNVGLSDQGEQQAQAQTEPSEEESYITERYARKGMGPQSGVKQAINNTLGALIKGQPFEETEQARSRLNLFSQAAIEALMISARGNQREQERLRGMIPNPKMFWKDPDAAKQRLLDIQEFLQAKLKTKQVDLRNTTLKPVKNQLGKDISTIREVMGLMPDMENLQESSTISVEEMKNMELKDIREIPEEKIDSLDEEGREALNNQINSLIENE